MTKPKWTHDRPYPKREVHPKVHLNHTLDLWDNVAERLQYLCTDVKEYRIKHLDDDLALLLAQIERVKKAAREVIENATDGDSGTAPGGGPG